VGWWHISNDGSGGFGYTEPGDLCNGDKPADILGPAVDKVIKAYEKAWGRKPFREELLAALDFVTPEDIENYND